MNVYLDNNILIEIEDGKYRVSDFLSVEKALYHYSDVHMSELLEARGNDKISQKGRLNLISQLCDKNYIVTGVLNPPEFMEESVEDAYKLSDNPIRQKLAQMACNDVPYTRIREVLDLRSSEFNNTPCEEVLSIVDSRMKEKLGMSLMTYLVASEAYGGKPLYYTLLKLIDTSNYWPEKKTQRSNIALLYDAAHAYSAQICDVLVTNDKRMSEKVTAIYCFLGIKTKIQTADDYLTVYGKKY